MVFDGLILQRVLAEISDVSGQQLRQVYQIGRSEFFFKFSKKNKEKLPGSWQEHAGEGKS